jgi:hypothetical protein
MEPSKRADLLQTTIPASLPHPKESQAKARFAVITFWLPEHPLLRQIHHVSPLRQPVASMNPEL